MINAKSVGFPSYETGRAFNDTPSARVDTDLAKEYADECLRTIGSDNEILELTQSSPSAKLFRGVGGRKIVPTAHIERLREETIALGLFRRNGYMPELNEAVKEVLETHPLSSVHSGLMPASIGGCVLASSKDLEIIFKTDIQGTYPERKLM